MAEPLLVRIEFDVDFLGERRPVDEFADTVDWCPPAERCSSCAPTFRRGERRGRAGSFHTLNVRAPLSIVETMCVNPTI